MEKNSRISANLAIIGIYNLLFFFFLCIALYFGQEILVPVVTAALLTVVFAPLVSYLESFFGRVISITIIVTLLFISAGIIGYTLSQQVISFSNEIPHYKENIRYKFESIQKSADNIFHRFTTTIEDVTKNSAPLTVKKTELQTNLTDKTKPIPVKVINNEFPSTSFYTLIFGSIFNFLAYTVLIMILLFFMLYYREDLNRRILYVLGKGQLSATNQAIEDAGDRVSRYLMALFIVNVFYGLSVTIALSIIGIPNAALWGIMGGILRFIPYIGFIISSIFPILLSLVISTGYLILFETIGFFLFIELIVSYFIEPIFYGHRTGVSPLALIIAAIFWTWLWGPMGLILAVPLTVCMVVIGTYIPKFKSLNILFGDRKALELHVELYYRIIGGDIDDAISFVDDYLKKHSLIELYDNIIIPMIIEVEKDYRDASLFYEKKEWVFQTIIDIINDLYLSPNENVGIKPTHTDHKVICIGARAERDHIASQIIAQLLTKLNINTTYISYSEKEFNEILKDTPDIICISIVHPTSIIHAKYICSKIQKSKQSSFILVGLWNQKNIGTNEIDKLKASGVNEVVTSMNEAITKIIEIGKSMHKKHH